MIRKWLSEISATSLSIFAIAGSVGGALEYMFGPWNKLFAGLFILMGADVITGVMKAIVKKSEKTEDGKLSSSVGIIGLFKKAGIIIVIMVVYVSGWMCLPNPEHAILARNITIFGFGFFEAKSILENLSKMGVEITPFVIKFMKLIGKKVDSADPENLFNTEVPDSDEEPNNEKESEEVDS